MSDYDAIVIGAGCGGLTTAAILAQQGRRVLILERNSRIGGCCSTAEVQGFRFDVGASIIEMTEPIDAVFRRLGTKLADEVDLIPCDPVVSVQLRDGTKMSMPASHEANREALARVSPEDAAAWEAYESYFRGLTDAAYATLFQEPANGITDLLRWFRKVPRLTRYLPVFLQSFQQCFAHHFSLPAQEAFGYQSVYFGASPELVPGMFAFFGATEHRGVYYPRGGMIQLPEALRRIGERAGMELRMRTPVARILIRDRRVEGVRLADGTEITAPVVVSNVNAKLTYQRLIGDEHLPPLVRRGIHSYDYGMTCSMVYLGLDARPPLDSHYSIVAPTLDEWNGYWRDRRAHPFVDRQFGLVNWSTCSDPGMAPEGKHVLNLTMGTYAWGDVDWDAEKQRLIDRVVDGYAEAAWPDLRDHLELALATTPWDFEREVGLDHGAIYGLDESLPSLVCFRPSSRSKAIGGLYLAGSSTSPGGGIPCVIASGSIAADLIDRYE